MDEIGIVTKECKDEFIQNFKKSSLLKTIRNNIKEDIQNHWVGNKNSIIGIQFIDFKDGIIKSQKEPYHAHLFMLQIWNFCNIFVESDKKITIQTWDGINFDDKTKNFLIKYVDKMIDEPENKKHFENENKFLKMKIWEQLDGLTPEEAVKKLEEFGF